MLRTHWIRDAASAKAYYRASDANRATEGEWFGKGAEMLGLSGIADYQDFCNLCDNINPLTGERLKPLDRAEQRIALDLNFNAVKEVSIARELAGPGNLGDDDVQWAHRDAVTYALQFAEADMRTRVRVGGRDDTRQTGNMIAFLVTHRDTRVSGEDNLPDMSLHDHAVCFNATYDHEEDRFKAADMAEIKRNAPFYEAIYHNRLASNLKSLGYGIERKGKAFAVAGIGQELVDKFSRRAAYIDEVATKLGITRPGTRSKLGATTRLGKTHVEQDDLTAYWAGRLTRGEKEQLTSLKGRPSHACSEPDAVAHAIGHHFERQAVVDAKRLYETAIRRGIGCVTVEGVQEEAERQGVIVKGTEATTRQVLAQERRIIRYAREWRGTCRALGGEGRLPAGPAPRGSNPIAEASGQPDPATLSAEQQAAIRHVWTSTDRIVLVRGGAGTGKTTMMQAAIAGIDRPVVVLAPSADASRNTLRKEGFGTADTVSRFLVDERFQSEARNGVIWVDEAATLSMRQADELFAAAAHLNARVVLQGDDRQHAAVERSGLFTALRDFAGLPVAELQDIRRQRGSYRDAVTAIAQGDVLGGYDVLDGLGWVHRTADDTALVDDYLSGVSGPNKKDVLIVTPTHSHGEKIAARIRERLKEADLLGTEERLFPRLKATGWTDAEKSDPHRYEGSEIIQLLQNAGGFTKGRRIRPADLTKKVDGRHLAVYTVEELPLAIGDKIRVTAGGKTKDLKHRLDNGYTGIVAGFNKDGDIVLQNDWVIDKAFGHIAHDYVSTSHKAQGRTVDRVLIALNAESVPAINSQAFYVASSRGRESARIFTDLPPEELRDAIQRSDPRRIATDLMGERKAPDRRKARTKAAAFVQRVKDAYRALRQRAAAAMNPRPMEREPDYAR